MMGASTHNLQWILLVILLLICSSTSLTTLKGVDLDNPVIDVTPSPFAGLSIFHGSKDALSCERVQVSGLSRLKLGSYANSFRVTLVPSVEIPEKYHGKIQVCFHRNASLGFCHCEKDDWRALQKGLWNSIMSPYEARYVDVKFTGVVPGSVTVSLEEDFQQWRLFCLAFGFVLLLLAPIVSNWVPFYYSSSMAIGVMLVIIVLLFQGMKLLPAGRKTAFYVTIYGSVIGAGSFLLHHFSMLVNSILVNFGLSEEMHNPVSIFVLLGVILAGAALGYWIVRKFVISEDGNVDVGVAQFVKWAMRIIATACILQSTLDTPLAMVALVLCWALSLLITSSKRHGKEYHRLYNENGSHPWLWSGKQTTPSTRAEFLSRKVRSSPRGGTLWTSPKKSFALFDSPIRGLKSPLRRRKQEQDYYSTFHKTPNRKKMTKQEWEEFTRESTREAMTGLASSPEFTDWIIENADRVRLLPDNSSDEYESDDSTEETAVESGSGMNLFRW